jgi:TolA-binding protein
MLIKMNGNGRVEFSPKTLVAVLTVVAIIFGMGGAWAAQLIRLENIKTDVDENCSDIAVLRARQHDIDVMLGEMSAQLKNINKSLERLEGKVDAIR